MFLCPLCAVPFNPADPTLTERQSDPSQSLPAQDEDGDLPDEVWLSAAQWRAETASEPVDIQPIQLPTDHQIEPEPTGYLDFSRIRKSHEAGPPARRERVSHQQRYMEYKLTGWDRSDSPEDDEEGGEDAPASGSTRSSILAVLAVVGVPVLIIGISLAIFSARSGGTSEDPTAASTDTASIAGAQGKFTPVESATMNRTMSAQMTAEVLAITEAFLNAETVSERAQFVRQPERVVPIMEQFYGGESLRPISHRPFAQDTKIGVIDSMLMLSVVLPDYSAHSLALERLESGEFRVDWESFVGLSEVPWGHLAGDSPKFSVFVRAKVLPSDYFNYGFEEEEWSCWQLEDATGEHRLFGYLPVGSDLDQLLKDHLEDRKKPSRMMMRVRFPDGPAQSHNQLEITEIIGRGWVLKG